MGTWTLRVDGFRVSGVRVSGVLKGSWDLVTRIINKVTILISTYNPN